MHGHVNVKDLNWYHVLTFETQLFGDVFIDFVRISFYTCGVSYCCKRHAMICEVGTLKGKTSCWMNRALFSSWKPSVICECCSIQKFFLLPYGLSALMILAVSSGYFVTYPLPVILPTGHVLCFLWGIVQCMVCGRWRTGGRAYWVWWSGEGWVYIRFRLQCDKVSCT